MAEVDFALLKERFEFLTGRDSVDHPAVNCPAKKLIECVTALRDEWGYDLLSDLTAIDWDGRSPRFTGIYHLFSTRDYVRLRIAVDCPDDAHPVLPSLTGLYPAANWHEREAYDLFGIRYEGHPNLKRILMWEGYPYHPLRKDFPLAGIEVPFPAADVAQSAEAKVLPAPMMGGPFVSSGAGTMCEIEPQAKDESWTEKEENR